MKKLLNSWVLKALAVTMVLATVGFQGSTVQAAALTSMSANASRLEENTNSDYEIFFVSPTGIQAGTSDDIILTFSSDFVLAAEAAINFDFAVGNSGTCSTASYTEETLALAASATEWGVDVTGNVVTFEPETDDTHAGGLCYRIRMGTIAVSGGTGAADTVQNGALDDDDTIIFSGGFGDTGTIAVDIIADDQVVITATLGPSISFAISDNTIGFGALALGASRFADGTGAGSATSTTAHTLTAATNATSGYVMYVFGDTLTSGGNNIDAIGGTNTAATPGTEQFGVRYDASGGSGTVTAPYAAAGYAYDATVTQDQIASSATATDTTTYDADYVANISIGTAAGNYETTLTYTATATF